MDAVTTGFTRGLWLDSGGGVPVVACLIRGQARYFPHAFSQ